MSERRNAELSDIENPAKPFYLAASIFNLNGSRDRIEGEGVEGCFATEAEAVQVLKELNEQYPSLEGYVYLCTPLRRVWRGQTKVTTIPKGKATP